MDNNEALPALNLDAETIAAGLRIRKEIYLKIVASFSMNLFGKIDVLESYFNENNREEIRRLLHEIKGTSANLRLADISAAESVIHEGVKGDAPLQDIRPRLADLRREAQRLKVYIQSLPG